MVSIRKRKRLRGSVLPLMAIAFVGICGFVALAVDVGRVAVARVQVQSAADVAATAAARALNGVLPQNLSAASSTATSSLSKYTILGQPLFSSTVALTFGSYHYDPVNQRFIPSFTLQAGENYNLVQATINTSCPTSFASVFGVSAFNVSASSMAVHRPATSPSSSISPGR